MERLIEQFNKEYEYLLENNFNVCGAKEATQWFEQNIISEFGLEGDFYKH